MSRLLARLILAILLAPVATAFYILAWDFVDYVNLGWNYDRTTLGASLLTFFFVLGYWIAVWRPIVRWKRRRVLSTATAALASLALGFGLCFLLLQPLRDAVAAFFVGFAASVTWLVTTTFIWRETSEERTARISSTGSNLITCPACSYNLTGLRTSACPECGSKFTLEELFASQPARESAELERS